MEPYKPTNDKPVKEGATVDIPNEIHDIKGDLSAAWDGLETEADEEFKRMGRKGILEAIEKLNRIEKFLMSPDKTEGPGSE